MTILQNTTVNKFHHLVLFEWINKSWGTPGKFPASRVEPALWPFSGTG